MIRFFKAKQVERLPNGKIAFQDLTRIPPWKWWLSNRLRRIDEWLHCHRPAVRWMFSPHGQRRIRRCFVWRADFRDLRIEFEVDPFMTFVGQGRWQLAAGYLRNPCEPACRVGFGVSPRGDEIYVDDLEVLPSLRRRGLARLLLKVVVERCSPPGKPLPIVPVQISADSVGFWDALQVDNEPELPIGYSMRRCEMDKAAGLRRMYSSLERLMTERACGR